MTGRGLVSFIGLGPGDATLRTERAAARMASADLALQEIDRPIASALVALAREGKRVVRLFAGGVLETSGARAEVREVARAGVPYEIVPGIGAGESAAAFAGVLGDVVRAPPSEVAGVVAGWSADAPVTLIADPGEPTQRVIVTSAGRAAEAASGLAVAEMLVAFGRPDEDLRWFERRPLFGRRVLVTRARDQAGGTAALLRDHGAEPRVVPTIAIEPPSDPRPLDRALSQLRAGAYAWVAFTSANGVERTWNALVASGADARAFGSSRLGAIGPATARALERHGLRADVVAEEFRGEGLAAVMLRAIAETGNPGRVLVPRAAKARDVLPDSLRAAGAVVDVVAAYETHPPPPETVDALLGELGSGRLDAVTFTSSSTVEHLCDLIGSRAPELLAPARVASIGPITTETARARGIRVDVTAREYTVAGLVEALSSSWG